MKKRSRSSDRSLTNSSIRSFAGPFAGVFTRLFARSYTHSFTGSLTGTLAVFCAFVTALVLLTGTLARAAEPYTATTMRLLRYEGTVEIEDSAGKQRPVMENARLTSGEAMKTGEASSASVGLDKGRIVTLDALSRVEFEKKAGALSMNLTEGKIFLDVSEKLDANETMDIKTSTMVVGIRGTIVYASNDPVTDENAADLKSVDLKGLAPRKAASSGSHSSASWKGPPRSPIPTMRAGNRRSPLTQASKRSSRNTVRTRKGSLRLRSNPSRRKISRALC